MTNKEKKLYHVLTYFFVVVLSCHILFAILLIFNPNKNYVTNQRWEKAYRLFGVTGPFFSENRIDVTPRVYCSIKEMDGTWSPFEELGKKEFYQFHQSYLNYDQLLLSGFPRYLCRQVSVSKPATRQHENFESIKKYIQISNPAIQIDSATLVYTLEYFSNNNIDTLFVKHIALDKVPKK